MVSEVNGLIVTAHELKSPLALIRQLSLSLDQTDPEAVFQRTQNQLVTVSDRALRQVNDLVKVARLEDGLFELEPVAVRGVCDEVTRELEQLFQKDRKNLKLKYSNKSKIVVANRELLFSIVYNFCVNALRYSEQGTRTELKIQDHQNKVKISVRDFGPALPTKIWRDLNSDCLDQPTNIAMRPGSSGLGLYIASKFSKYMRGQLGAVRHKDGTSFWVELPVSAQAQLPLF